MKKMMFVALAIGSGHSMAMPHCSFATVPIPDDHNPGVDVDIVVTDVDMVQDLTVQVLIEHTWIGDLQVEMTHLETANTVMVLDRPGRLNGQDPGCEGDNVDAIFDDSSQVIANDECNNLPAIGGVVKAEEPLSAFDGESIAGTWRFKVSDRNGGETGQVMTICLNPAPACDAAPPIGDSDIIWFNGFQCVN